MDAEITQIITDSESRLGRGLRNYFSCPECDGTIYLNDQFFELYFNDKKTYCPICKKQIDLWNIFIGKLGPRILALAGHYSILGCIRKEITIIVYPDSTSMLNLIEYSPELEDGELLFIYFEPKIINKTLISPYINAPLIYPKDLFFKFKNIPIYIPPYLGKEKIELNIVYWFAPKEINEDLSNILLLDAFKFFIEKRFDYAIISAHSSVEILYNKFFEELLANHNFSNTDIKNFLNANSANQFEKLLPFVSKITHHPQLNFNISSGLTKLRQYRNKIIHNGKINNIDEDELKKGLMSAFLIFKFIEIIYKN
ncbi:MAG: hypothetical protein FGO69_09640 [Methanobacterium sp.]|nr:MAG: hypothetical protein FGO69_09640 [Methanobacterium sp.]